ncbi:MAG: flagellar hook-length control protein FliK, partial [Planctomycetota bacterium]
ETTAQPAPAAEPKPSPPPAPAPDPTESVPQAQRPVAEPITPVEAAPPTAAGVEAVEPAGRIEFQPARPAATPPPTPVATPGETAEPNVDQLASRVSRWRNLGLLNQGGSARIRLDPPSLGSVDVTLRTAGSTVQVELTVESDSVRHLLRTHSDRLAQGLQSHGLQASRIEINVQTPADAPADQQGDTADDGGTAGRNDDGGQGGRQPQRDRDRTFRQDIEDQLNVTV